MYACSIGTLRVPLGTAETYKTTSYNRAYGWADCCGNTIDYDFDTDKVKARTTHPEPTAIIYESITKTPWMMNVRLEPTGAVTTIDWQSSHPDVATIDHGLITYLQDEAHSSFTATTAQGHVATSPFMTDVENISTDNAAGSHDVYNLQGIRVLKNASADDLRRLPVGLYIYNGAKIYVR